MSVAPQREELGKSRGSDGLPRRAGASCAVGKSLSDYEIAARERDKYGCGCDVEAELARHGRPLHLAVRPAEAPRAPRGPRSARSWDAEAAKRMLMNNLDPANAVDWQHLVVYGGSGRAVRNWHEFHKVVSALDALGEDESLCVQSGRAVYVARTHPGAPRVILANSNLVPRWATQQTFDALDRAGLTMYGQMTAGSWIYIGTQGILQGTYQTYLAAAERHFGVPSLRGKLVLSSGLGGMSGAQPLAVTLNDGVIIDVEVRPERVERKLREGYCDRMTASVEDALGWADEARRAGQPLSIGLVGNAADVYPELVARGAIPDLVSDQTPAHDLGAYVPSGDLAELDALRSDNLAEYHRRALASIARHVEAILEMQERGAVAFDYGNNLRAQAEAAGVTVRDANGAFLYPGFVPAYIRPLFARGMGPFRWAALSGDPRDIHALDAELLRMFPDDEGLTRWIRLASERVPFLGLPTRICWLGYGDRARFGQRMNELVQSGALSAPIAIGRDHLDCGSVASPDRETEAMNDGSDAIADWPLLNFALNTAAGASWVSFHHGGGVGIGNSLHAGMVIVADGSEARAERLDRVLTVDPGIGVARHALAGYEPALETARQRGLKLP
jgi:urocanate hydratase